MLREQVAAHSGAAVVPCVVGGFTEHQFVERRLPTIENSTRPRPATPVFILHLYDRALLNGAALRAVGYTRDTPNPPGGEIVRDGAGNPTGLLLAQAQARPFSGATLAKDRSCRPSTSSTPTRHFMREVNRLGGDRGHRCRRRLSELSRRLRTMIEQLHAAAGQLTVRGLPQPVHAEAEGRTQRFQDVDGYRQSPGRATISIAGNGAGEMLVYSAADFEDFRVERPGHAAAQDAGDLEPVIRLPRKKRRGNRAPACHLRQRDAISGARGSTCHEKVARGYSVPRRLQTTGSGEHAEVSTSPTAHRPYQPCDAALRSACALRRRSRDSAAPHGLPAGRITSSETLRRQGDQATPPGPADALERGVKVGAGTDAAHCGGVIQPVGIDSTGQRRRAKTVGVCRCITR